jgi:hypothetical protein
MISKFEGDKSDMNNFVEKGFIAKEVIKSRTFKARGIGQTQIFIPGREDSKSLRKFEKVIGTTASQDPKTKAMSQAQSATASNISVSKKTYCVDTLLKFVSLILLFSV